MSVEAHAWAKKQRTGSPTLKAVLAAIADYADDRGRAWPSQLRLADDTELSERAVRNAIAGLEDGGFLRREQRRRADGSRATDVLHLNFTKDANRQEMPVDMDLDDQQPARGAAATGTSFQTNRHVVPQQPARGAGLTTFEPSKTNHHQNSSEANASGAPDRPGTPPAVSLTDRLWLDGVAALVGQGITEKLAKQMIGRWLRVTGGDAGRVMWAIEEAVRARTRDPIPYVTSLLSEAPGTERSSGRQARAKPTFSNGTHQFLAEQMGFSDDATEDHDRRPFGPAFADHARDGRLDGSTDQSLGTGTGPVSARIHRFPGRAYG